MATILQFVPLFAGDAVHPDITMTVMDQDARPRSRRRRRPRRVRSFWKRVKLGRRVIDAVIKDLATL